MLQMNKEKTPPESQDIFDEQLLTPSEIVEELDRYIIAQEDAKKAVAIALRNRWRRLRVPSEIREEITPKNIIMIGPTGVGKTEISRRLAKLSRAPFVKVEASKFTEVGYVGRDVDSIVRDLVEAAHSLVREEERQKVFEKAEKMAEEQLLDLLLPGSRTEADQSYQGESSLREPRVFLQDQAGIGYEETAESLDDKSHYDTREKLRKLLKEGRLEDRVVEVEITKQFATQMQILGPQGFGEIEGQIKDVFSNLMPKQREIKKLPVGDARKLLIQESQDGLIEEDQISRLAIQRAEQTGIVFIDEIDKICGGVSGKGPDVSREGVQRDLLPLVEGSSVNTKYGMVKTDHVLFIASGAFHSNKPSDLMPEFQGRFPIRVELKSLSAEHFIRILTEPQNALTRQYQELLKTEGVELEFTEDGIAQIAELTAEVNDKTENIGARRLHTLLEKLLEDISFVADKRRGDRVLVDRAYVLEKLASIASDSDLSRFIL
jgi:ATP-dependent HslUV protease ATP-binding subunit HslU